MRRTAVFTALVFVLLAAPAAADDTVALPDTVWLYTNILDESDPTSFGSVTYRGRGDRGFWDPYIRDWHDVEVYLFDVQYIGRSGLTEYQVHTEFGNVEDAREQVDKYGPILGRLPAALLSNAREVEISIGREGDGAGGNGMGIFHIHTNGSDRAIESGRMEEVLLHEGSHVSLDHIYAKTPGWLAAQEADGMFISPYAREHPDREDMAESIWGYFVVNYRPERVSAAHRDAIVEGIPNRLAFFDRQGLDMSPYVRVTEPAPVPALPLVGTLLLAGLLWTVRLRLRS